VCAILSSLEILFPKVDAHAFILMAALTVYSAITQPALAYVGGQSSDHSEEVLERVEQLEQNILAMEERILAKIEAMDKPSSAE
jgi:hypothetical protein